MADVCAALPDAFDGVAASYDADFSHRPAGRLLREAVWRHLTPFVRRGANVLDLGCGTGEDALWLARMGCSVVAVDGSPAMLALVRRKAALNGLESWIETARFDVDQLPDLGMPFDLVLSNFGALNCATDLSRLRRIAVRPGGVVALTVMGRFCAWETLWHGLHLRRAAVRRWRGHTTAVIDGKTIAVRYWTVRQIVEALGPGFRKLAVHGIGTAIPPSEVFDFIERRPGLLGHLSRWETRLASQPAFASLADHRLVILRREGS